MLKHITTSEFEEEVLNYQGKVLVDFFASWCGPCQMLTPGLSVSNTYIRRNQSLKILKINIDEETKLAIENKVEVVPTMILYNNGKVEKRIEGYREAQELKREIL